MPLTLNTRQVGDVTIIRCAGRIVTGGETDSLRDHIRGLLLDHRDLILHLDEVVFVAHEVCHEAMTISQWLIAASAKQCYKN